MAHDSAVSQGFTPNVIVFGDTGVGKSSVINMILGSDKANVSNGARGETFKSDAYTVQINGNSYSLHDTVGLGEHSGGTVDSIKAVNNLYHLVTRLSSVGGVNLLIFVVSCGRLTETTRNNYILFHKGFCDSEVPIVIVVTRCEDIEPTMDTWWIENELSFTQAGMLFNGHACVCASKGRMTPGGIYRNGDLVEESKKEIKQLIVRNCKQEGWKKQPIDWLKRILGFVTKSMRFSKLPDVYSNLSNRLTSVFSVVELEAALQEDLSNGPIANIIVFGETGAGKSSVINMILGHDKASVSTGASGETFKSTAYPVQIYGKHYSLHDTVGLGEHSGGTVDTLKAVQNLYRLVTRLSSTGGVNLLILVVKCGRLTETARKIYTLFHHGFCESKVPIVIVVTHCEAIEPTMDTWWTNNEPLFTLAGMSFDNHACVCASKGKRTDNGRYRNQDLVEKSENIIKQLILQHCMQNGWEKQPVDWFKRVLAAAIDLLWPSKIPTIYTHLSKRLTKAFSPSEVEDIIAAVVRDNEYSPNVILLDETGAGNSTIISMILGSDKVKVTDGAHGASFQSTAVQIDGKTYNFHDTVGLGEYGGGTVENPRAVQDLYRLVMHLYNAGGINLLILIVKCGRFTESTLKSCVLLHHGFCNSKVPIVIVGTHCENVEKCTWWIDNKTLILQDRNFFKGHACVSASMGSEKTNDSSQLPAALERLIVQHGMLSGCKNPMIDSSQPRTGTIKPPRSSKIPASYHTNLHKCLKDTFSDSEVRNIFNAIGVPGARAKNLRQPN